MSTYVLKDPIEWGKERGLVTELTIHELKAKHLRALPAKPAMGDLLDVVGKMVGEPKAFIDELSARDAMALQKIVGDFLGDGLESGDSASA